MASSIEDEILAITVTSAANKIHSIQNEKKRENNFGEGSGCFAIGNIRSSPPLMFLLKSSSENVHQIYRRTPMPKCDFNKFFLHIF